VVSGLVAYFMDTHTDELQAIYQELMDDNGNQDSNNYGNGLWVHAVKEILQRYAYERIPGHPKSFLMAYNGEVPNNREGNQVCVPQIPEATNPDTVKRMQPFCTTQKLSNNWWRQNNLRLEDNWYGIVSDKYQIWVDTPSKRTSDFKDAYIDLWGIVEDGKKWLVAS